MPIYPRGSYQVWLCNPYGHRLALLQGLQSIQYSRVNPVSAVGSFAVNLGTQYDRLADIACLVEIWRAPFRGHAYRHEGTYILEKWQATGRYTRTLAGEHVNKLARFRIVTEYKETTYADKTGPGDDLIKQYAREQLGALAQNADRDFNNWFPFTVEPAYGQWPTVTKEASHANVLDTAQAIVKAIANDDANPTWGMFEIVPTGHDLDFGVQLRTYTDYRDADRGLDSLSPLVLSENDCLEGLKRTRDHDKEWTWAMVGGSGNGDGRQTVEVQDRERSSLAPWWRREVWSDGGDVPSVAAITTRGYRKLRDGKPVDRFEATLRPHPSLYYGGLLDLGGKYGVYGHGQFWSARCEVVQVNANESSEKIDFKLETV